MAGTVLRAAANAVQEETVSHQAGRIGEGDFQPRTGASREIWTMTNMTATT